MASDLSLLESTPRPRLGSEVESMELSFDDEEKDLQTNKVFVLRKRETTIYPFDYKYKLSTTNPVFCPRFVNVPTIIVLVGLPARGKTYMAKKLGRYLNWIGISTKVFNVGEYRRKAVGTDKLHDFFRVDNKEALQIRRKCALDCLEDTSAFLGREGHVAIFDATNTTRERRQLVLDFCSPRGFRVFFMESVCTKFDVVDANIKDVKVFSPDYVGTKDREAAVQDFKERIKHYEDAYEPLDPEVDGNLSFIKIINTGEQFLVNNVDGYLQSRAVYFLMNMHIRSRSIYLTRNGQSADNAQRKIGGDSDLNLRGEEFAFALANFLEEQKLKDVKVWTSQLKRAVDTSKYIKNAHIEQWKALNEMDYGVYEGLTHEEIERMDPEEHKVMTEHPFNSRYHRGESYSDVCARLEPVIMELERQTNVLVICHEAVIQCLMAYFLDHSSADLTHLRIPMHTVFKLTPIAYGCRVERYPLFVSTPIAPSKDEDR